MHQFWKFIEQLYKSSQKPIGSEIVSEKQYNLHESFVVAVGEKYNIVSLSHLSSFEFLWEDRQWSQIWTLNQIFRLLLD